MSSVPVFPVCQRRCIRATRLPMSLRWGLRHGVGFRACCEGMPALRVLSAFCSAAGAHNPPRIRSGRLLLLGDLVVRVLFRERLDVRAEVLADGFGILERLELLGAEVGVVVDRARAARIAAAALEADGEGVGGGVVADAGDLRAVDVEQLDAAVGRGGAGHVVLQGG
ncbi:hypothetical protein G6F46_013389 [Rhizopus delemar]|nr:hypothetical protein G6F46_013389 [Rhizopus delemar]